MTAITVEDLDNAKLDVDHIAEIATSLNQSATDRLGHIKLTITGAIDTMTALNPRGQWITATAYAVKDLFSDSGITYVTVVAHTSTSIAADLAAGKIALYQGVLAQTVRAYHDGVDFTAGTTASLTLPRAPGAPGNLVVHFDGVYQGPDQWTVTGTTLTFNDAIPLGVTTVYAHIGVTLSASIPPDASVGDNQLAWGASLGRVVASRDELKTLDTNRYRRAFVLGYAAAGDRGGLGAVWFDPSSSAADNGGSIVAPDLGTGRWRMANPDILNPFQFGAKGDKVTDDTLSIQTCYDAVPVGGTLHLPHAPGDAYLVSSQGGGYCLNFSRMVHIRAEGLFAALQPVAGSTVNTILLKPDPAGAYYGMTWEGLVLGDPYTGTRAGNNGLFIDTQVEGSQLPAAIFRALNVMTGTVANGFGILHVNTPSGININGGMYGTSFEDCIVRGGFNLQASGDSNIIKRALISGPNVGVYFSLTAGASLLTLQDCNITSTGGTVLADSGSRFKLMHCNCEQIQSFTQSIAGFTTDCMVNLRGSNGTISTPELIGNHFGLFSGIVNAAVVRVSNVVGGKAEGNVLLNANAGAVGFLTSSTDFRVGSNTYGTAIVTKVQDTGTGTMGVNKLLAATLSNGWVESGNAPTATFVSYKTPDGMVVVDGKLANGTTTPGTPFATLPSGHRPPEPREFPVVTYNGSTMVPGHVRVDTDGTLRFMAGNATALYLSGIRFMASDLADAISDL